MNLPPGAPPSWRLSRPSSSRSQRTVRTRRAAVALAAGLGGGHDEEPAMNSPSPDKPGPARLTPAEQAGALAPLLREEFGADFAFYDASTGAPLPPRGDEGSAWEPAAVIDFATAGRAGARPLADGRLQVALPLRQGGRVTLVARAALTAVATARAGLELECARLTRWARSVCDRLGEQPPGRGPAEEDAEGVEAAWKTVLSLDRLMRGLRLHRPSPRSAQRIL